MGGARGVQPGPATLIVQDLEFDGAEAGKFLTALKGRFLGAPKAAERQSGVWLAQAPGYFSRREILDIERL